MGYRGEDLDLRTPQTWSAGGPDLGATIDASGGGRGRRSATLAARSGPIWVDDAVMACCNHAYDVAVAHRASEVRLEHLLHALTRIDAASEVLEAHGVRVAALRRETATLIASELPVAMGNGTAAPRRSNEMAEALRLAAAHAYRRNAPAGVADLLHVFFEVKPDLAGLAVLMRHSGRSGPELVEQPAPPPRQPAYVAEPRFEPTHELPRDRIRPPRTGFRPPEPAPSARPTTIDNFQNARLDALEAALRNLSHDITEERAGFVSLIKELQRDVTEQREDVSRHSGGLYDRLQHIETLVQSTDSGDLDRTVERLLQGIETAIQQRVGELTRVTTALADRLTSLEHSVRDNRQPAPDLSPVHSRIERLEHALRDGVNDSNRHWMGLADRLKSVDLALQSPALKVDLAPISNRLDIIEEALLSRDDMPVREVAAKLTAVEQPMREITARLMAVEQPVRDITQRLVSLEQPVRDITARLAAVEQPMIDASQRLGGVEQPLRDLAARVAMIEQGMSHARTQAFETTSSVTAEVKALAGAIATQASNAERFQAAIATRVDGLAGHLERHRGEIVQALAAPAQQTGEHLQGIVRLIDARQSDMAQGNARLEATVRSVEQNIADLMRAVEQNTATLLRNTEASTANVVQGLEQRTAGMLQVLSDNTAGLVTGLEQKTAGMLQVLSDNTAGMVTGLEQKTAGMVQGLEVSTGNQLRALEQGLVAHVTALQQGLAAHVEKSGEYQATYARDLADLHDALVKLNANQHTLAGSIDQWRTEAAGDLSILSNRLASVERDAQRPMQLLSSVAADIDSMRRYSIDRAARRSRFWYWLFGTDDWLGDSWPSQTKKIEAARIAAQTRAVTTASETRRA